MRGLKLFGMLSGTTVVQYVEPQQAYEGGRRIEGKQARNADGVLLWRLTCLHTMEGERPEIIYVKIASDAEPLYEIGDVIDGKTPFKVVAYERNGRVEYSLTIADKPKAARKGGD